ncbi:EAL domain-containing protein [Devosia sp.]|uniref:EAL domain-containing protein n=1 Tax=Devosia sp. TaxID=1871048 RepID=UPI0037C0CF3C
MCPPPTHRIDADDVDDVEAGSEKTPALLTAKLRRTQRLLRRQTARLEATLDAITHGFAMFDSRDRLITCNLAFLNQYSLPVSCARTGTSLQRILEARITAGTHVGDPEQFIAEHLALARTAHGVSRDEQLQTGELVTVGFRPMADGGFVWTQKASAPQALIAEAARPAAEAVAVDDEPFAEVQATEIDLELPVMELDLPETMAAEELAIELPEGLETTEDDLAATLATANTEVALVDEDEDDLMAGFGASDDLDIAADLPDLEAAAITIDGVLDGDALVDVATSAEMLAEHLLVESAALEAETALDTAIDDAASAIAGLDEIDASMGVDDDISATAEVEVEMPDLTDDNPFSLEDAAVAEPVDDPMAFELPMDDEVETAVSGDDPLAAWAEDLAEDAGEDPLSADVAFDTDLDDMALDAEDPMASEDVDMPEPVGAQSVDDPEPVLFIDLDSELRRALASDELTLVYQPILSMQSQAIVGFEALLRWMHPEHGELSAAQFMSLAETTSQIVPVGAWVLEHALAEAAHWPERYRVAINISPAQFRDGDLATALPALLEAHGVAAERVELEFTESLFVTDGKANLEKLQHLRSMGIKLALDDFCAGQSSIQDVMAFAFDRIKVDGDFIRLADAAGPAPAVVRAFAELGQWLGIPATAEGIETAEQLRAVHALGYAEAQGFLIARPMDRFALMGLIGADYRDDGDDADPLADFDLEALSATA